MRPGHLEVEEPLRVDLGEAVRVPELGQVAGRERRSLPTVVPAAERRDEHGAAQRRPVVDDELVAHALSLGVRQSMVASATMIAQIADASATWINTSHQGS